MNNNRALVLLSGGQDSTTALAWALSKFDHVEALCINYGQRHAVETECARTIARLAKVPLHFASVSGIGSGTALVDHEAEVNVDGGMDGLPSTFVPGRNAVFLSLASGLAASIDAGNVVTGVCQTDYSGYPDCRDHFVKAMTSAMGLALDRPLQIHTPLMWLTKAETVRLMLDLESETVPAIAMLAETHTCYEGKRPACGKCPACELRLAGFAEAGVTDPIDYE